MKANELQIGDWVRKLERGGHSIPVKIIAIYEYNADYETRDGNVGCMSIHGYEPITLTVEILEKNGFTRYRENEELWDVGVIRLDLGLFAVGIDNGCGTGICIMPYGIMALYCKYVHELQHALRLCGIEKEIEL